MTTPEIPVFVGGQMTDLPPFTLVQFDGTELFEVVAPGDPALGLNYSITSARLAALITRLVQTAVYLADGQHNTPGDPYVVPATVARVYVNKTAAEPTYVQFAAAAGYPIDVLVADVAGTVDGAGNGITVTFSGGELADGIATIPITTPYGGYIFQPLQILAAWRLGTA